jgi:hypothetical protein
MREEAVRKSKKVANYKLVNDLKSYLVSHFKCTYWSVDIA